MADLYQQGQFEKAIPIAEKIVSLEKKTDKGSELYAQALVNLAELYKAKAKALKDSEARLPMRERINAFLALRDAAENSKKNFRAALDVYDLLNMSDTAGASAAKSELALVTWSFIHDVNSPREYRDQVDAAEKLYSEALASEQKLSPPAVELQMRTLQDFATLYMTFVNFEKALPLYEQYVSLGEQGFGKNSKHLLPGLNGLLTIHSFVLDDPLTTDLQKKITQIDSSAKLEIPPADLVYRTRGIARVKGDGFIAIDMSHQDQPYSASRGRVGRPGSFKVVPYEVDIVVDEEGKVIDAKPAQPSKFDKELIDGAMASTFRPLTLNGSNVKFRGKIVYRREE